MSFMGPYHPSENVSRMYCILAERKVKIVVVSEQEESEQRTVENKICEANTQVFSREAFCSFKGVCQL
jgi:hypothetical protein